MLTITKENYKETIQNNTIVVIDFWAQFCPPCQEYKSIFQEVSRQYPEIVFATLHSEEEIEISDYFFIQNTPTTVFMKEKTVLFKKPGVLSHEELTALTEQTKEMDMDAFLEEKAKRKKKRRGTKDE